MGEKSQVPPKKPRISPMWKRTVSQIFTKPATTKYPFVKPQLGSDFRGEQVFDIKLCVSCGLCSRDCPAKAIEMVEVDGKKRPQFMLDRCVFCYQCAESCPRNAIKSSVIYELATTDKPSLVIKPRASSATEATS
ncbi:MAG TPA: 4Fe-4S binding protein [Candidatus Limnocylindrales bacterium]|nr:4Fe-4S binding protein [Candidatus Limnocylindrales bacterium]